MYDVCNKSSDEILYTCADNHDIPVQYVETIRVPGHRGKGEKRQFKYKRHYTKMEAREIASKSSSWLRNTGLVTYQGFLIEKFDGVQNATIEPYSLGVFLGDGSSGDVKIKKRICIDCSSEEVMIEVSKHYPIMSIKKMNKYSHYRFSTNSNFYKELIKYKLDGKKSGTKFIPDACKKSDMNYRLKLLAGLIDTDGYINKNGIITYTTKSLQFAKDIQEICRSLGGNTNIKEIKKNSEYSDSDFPAIEYNVQINIGKLQPKIPIKRPLKIGRLTEPKQLKNKVGIIVKKTKPGMVYGFELDSESHLYITDNYSVTHNSTLAQQVAYFLAWLLAGGTMVYNEEIEKWGVGKSPEKPVRFSVEDNIVFSPDELMKKASSLFRKYGKNQVIVYDEGRAGLDSARAMQAVNKVMQDFFQECGQYGHVIIIVLPSFFKLHEDYATSRSLFLIDVYADRNLRRGFFNFYTEQQKEYLYLMGKKKIGTLSKYVGARHSFNGKFTKFLPVPSKTYDRAKSRALKQKELNRTDRKWKQQRDGALYLIRRETEMEYEQLARELTVICGFPISAQMMKSGVANITKKKEDD